MEDPSCELISTTAKIIPSPIHLKHWSSVGKTDTSTKILFQCSYSYKLLYSIYWPQWYYGIHYGIWRLDIFIFFLLFQLSTCWLFFCVWFKLKYLKKAVLSWKTLTATKKISTGLLNQWLWTLSRRIFGGLFSILLGCGLKRNSCFSSRIECA